MKKTKNKLLNKIDKYLYCKYLDEPFANFVCKKCLEKGDNDCSINVKESKEAIKEWAKNRQ